jgi:hypothetical protein
MSDFTEVPIAGGVKILFPKYLFTKLVMGEFGEEIKALNERIQEVLDQAHLELSTEEITK